MDKISAAGGVFVNNTIVTPDWLNNVQDEIISVIEGAGIVLDGNLTNQLESAITTMIAAATGGDAIDFTLEDSGATVRLNQKVTGGYLKYSIIGGTAHILTAADCGRLLIFTSNSPVALTCPQSATEDLTAGFNCIVRYNGTGTLTIANEGTDILEGDGAVMDVKGAEIVIDLQTAGAPNTYFVKGDAS